ANELRALRFGQDIFLASEASEGGLDAANYVEARKNDILATRTLGIDAYMDEHRLDAILFPGRNGAAVAAKAGYPSVQVPAGMIAGPSAALQIPFGATFASRAWSEPVLLRLAYAFEQATKARRMPLMVPPLEAGCEVQPVTTADK